MKILLTFLFVMIPSLVSGFNPPPWVLGQPHPEFPKEQYIVGVGISQKNMVLAADSARMELAKRFKVEIRSTMYDLSTRENSISESILQTDVEAILEGIEISDGWFDEENKYYYSFATLDRAFAAVVMRDSMEEMLIEIEEYMTDGIGEFEDGNYDIAYRLFLKGRELAEQIPLLRSILRFLGQSTEYNLKYKEIDFTKRIKQTVHTKRIEASRKREKIRAAWNEEKNNTQPVPQDIWDELEREKDSFTIRIIGERCIHNGSIIQECL